VIILVSGSTKTVQGLVRRREGNLGLLLTPANRNSVASVVATGLPWAMDNGAYSGFDAVAFRRKVARFVGQPRLLFVCCPDVVGKARETLESFEVWRGEIAARGLPVALVGQDGAEDLELPWDCFDAWFVGGSTRWKLSAASADLIGEAKRRGKHCHMGRVNSRRRLRIAGGMGCDSVDGSSLSMYGDKYIHKFCRWAREVDGERARQPMLF
jgi:hypothetical protein